MSDTWKEMPLPCPACRTPFIPEKRSGVVLCPNCRMPIDLGQKCPECGDDMVFKSGWSMDGAEEYVCKSCYHTIAPYELYEGGQE